MTLLCLANFPAGTGYAWRHFERLVAGVGDRLAPRNEQVAMAYPPGGRTDSPIVDTSLRSAASVRAVVDLIRSRDVRTVFMFDRPARSAAYPMLRAAGVRRIVVYDHTSGNRTMPHGLKRLAKQAANHVPGLLADRVLAVSDYVATRQRDIACVPAERVMRIWNGIDPVVTVDRDALRRRLPVRTHAVICVGRAAPEKGVAQLIRAFAQVARRRPDATLVYVGDGPALSDLRGMVTDAGLDDRICCVGYQAEAAAWIDGADIAVVPSLWQEAFGLAALEPMARGIPVIASRVGGLPEVVEDGVTGTLVPPGDESALAAALDRMLADPALARRMGEAGRQRATAYFRFDQQVDALAAVLAGDA